MRKARHAARPGRMGDYCGEASAATKLAALGVQERAHLSAVRAVSFGAVY